MSSILDRPDKILYAEDEKPPLGITLLLATTHVALIFDAVVFIPNVLGKVTGATPEQIRFSCFITILVSAICSLIQVLKIGRLGTGFILFMGSYSAFLSCSIDAAKLGGLALVATMSLLSVPVVLLFSYFFKYFRHIVTPAVGGIVIILVGVNLIPIGLYCDGLGKLLSGLGGGAPISTYCDNIPLIEMTGVASKSVGIYGSILLGLLAFIPKAGAIILDMPSPVIGGMLIAIAAMLFYSGIGLVMESGLNNQTGLMLGVSITVGMIAESEVFFPNIMPTSLSPLLQNGVAMGGFTAFALSVLIRLAPRKKTSFSVAAKTRNLPDLMLALGDVALQLKLSEAEIKRTELACEEIFMHLISEIKGENPKVLFKFIRNEEGIFTEAIIGNCVSDIVNMTPPGNLMAANDDETQNLGIYLLSSIVREIRHIQISGVTYVSFII